MPRLREPRKLSKSKQSVSKDSTTQDLSFLDESSDDSSVHTTGQKESTKGVQRSPPTNVMITSESTLKSRAPKANSSSFASWKQTQEACNDKNGDDAYRSMEHLVEEAFDDEVVNVDHPSKESDSSVKDCNLTTKADETTNGSKESQKSTDEVPKMYITYKGEWMDNQMHGKGEFTNGDKHFVGNFCRGKRTKGKETLPNGIFYDGEWNDNEQYHGKGIYVGTEETFIGSWKNGQKHGRGVMKFLNGNSFCGEWKDDEPYDIGIATYANGQMRHIETREEWDKLIAPIEESVGNARDCISLKDGVDKDDIEIDSDINPDACSAAIEETVTGTEDDKDVDKSSAESRKRRSSYEDEESIKIDDNDKSSKKSKWSIW